MDTNRFHTLEWSERDLTGYKFVFRSVVILLILLLAGLKRLTLPRREGFGSPWCALIGALVPIDRKPFRKVAAVRKKILALQIFGIIEGERQKAKVQFRILNTQYPTPNTRIFRIGIFNLRIPFPAYRHGAIPW